MMKFFYAKAILPLSIIFLPAFTFAQTTIGTNTDGSNYVAYPIAVPFLNITPDSRSGALGDAGVAISPDVNATYWNPSKLAFLTDDDDVSLSYSPWLRQLVPDISLSYLDYAHKLDDRNAIGLSLRYFNYGTIQFRDANQNDLGTYSPNELHLAGSFARKFGDELSLALSAGFVHSNLSNAFFATGTGAQTKAGNAVTAGVSFYYNSKLQEFGGEDATLAFGLNISNIGSKVSYSNDGPAYFLPTNLKLGVANTVNLDDYNQLTFTVDFNKLLVPTPPILDANGNIVKGESDNVSVPEGIFQSFSDAPGGFSQQMQEISISAGLEYWFNQLFALRAGYFYENPVVGGSHYLTTGVGFKYQEFDFDFSYLAATQQNSPLANTLRFTLIANFGGDKNVNKH
jgi:hypothetical protein